MTSAIRSLVLFLATAGAAGAAGPLSPEAFEALAQGHTLHFSLNGAPFGAEQYFAGRRSLWRFEDGSCEAGTWWAEGDQVCFHYGEGAPQCWRFRPGGGGYEAALVEDGAETGFVLRMDGRDEVPLDCPAPEVGS